GKAPPTGAGATHHLRMRAVRPGVLLGLVALLSGCAAAGGSVVPPVAVKAADPCAVPPDVQGRLIHDDVLPLLNTYERSHAIYTDDCPTAMDTAWTWWTGTGAAGSFQAFLAAGWRRAPPDIPEGWSYAVLGDAGGHTFRVDLSCTYQQLPPELA